MEGLKFSITAPCAYVLMHGNKPIPDDDSDLRYWMYQNANREDVRKANSLSWDATVDREGHLKRSDKQHVFAVSTETALTNLHGTCPRSIRVLA